MIGLGTRIAYAFRCLVSILFRAQIPQDVLAALVPGGAGRPAATPPGAAPAPAGRAGGDPDGTDRAVQLLALLQRDGRLVDFLAEDIAAYSDAQIGAAARDVHRGCREAITRYVHLEPILASEEGQTVALPPGLDPTGLKLIGNVPALPPSAGVLRHRGWRAARIALPPLPAAGRWVVAPAEVEIP